MQRIFPAGIILLSALQSFAADQSKNEARVTRVIRQMELVDADRSFVRPAAVNDKVAGDTAVRTGEESRGELTFKDLTITRLGENSIFTFSKAGRDVQLSAGSVLLHVPKNSGGAHMATEAVSVAITGTTVILKAKTDGRSVLTALEDGARVSLIKHPSESVYVREGQMVDVPKGAIKMPKPVNIDLKTAMNTPLITDFPPLPKPTVTKSGTNKPKSSAGGEPSDPSGSGPSGPAGGGSGSGDVPGQTGGGNTGVANPKPPPKPKKPKIPNKPKPPPKPPKGGNDGIVNPNPKQPKPDPAPTPKKKKKKGQQGV